MFVIFATKIAVAIESCKIHGTKTLQGELGGSRCSGRLLIIVGISDNKAVAAPQNIFFIFSFISLSVQNSTAKVHSSARSTKFLGYSVSFCDEWRDEASTKMNEIRVLPSMNAIERSIAS